MDFSNYKTTQDFQILDQDLKDKYLAWMAAQADVDITVLSHLIEAGANVNFCTADSGLSPLILATTTGHIKSIELLIQSGANLSASTISYETALSRAIFYQFYDKASLIFNKMSEVHLNKEIEFNALRQQKYDPMLQHASNPFSCFVDIKPESLFQKLKALKPVAEPLIFSSTEPKATSQNQLQLHLDTEMAMVSGEGYPQKKARNKPK